MGTRSLFYSGGKWDSVCHFRKRQAVSSQSEDVVPCDLAVPFLYKNLARCSTRKVLLSTVTKGKKGEGGDISYPQKEVNEQVVILQGE